VALAPLRAELAVLRAQLGEQRRHATVLFAELESPGAADSVRAREERERQALQLGALVAQYGGIVNQFTHDVLMAVWGLDAPREDDPANAVRAGLAMLAGAGVLRAGVNTGLVLAGTIDSTGERSVVGDAVNLAARLQQTAPAHALVAGQATYDVVRGLFETHAQTPLRVKGKSKPVQSYRVTGERPAAFTLSTRGLAGVTTRTVGRESELAVLEDAYLSAASGGVRWVTVTGEAGVGKSRLLSEFLRWLEGRPGRGGLMRARAWAHTQHLPYFVLRDLFSAWCGINPGDAPAMAREKLTRAFSAVLGDSGPESAAFAGQLLGFDFSHTSWIANIVNDPRQIRGRAAVLLQALLDALCAAGIVVLLLEDLHWADRESLDFLGTLLAEPGRRRLCVVGLARLSFWDRPLAWGLNAQGETLDYHQRLSLAPLAGEQATELAHEILQKIADPPAWLVELLVERGGGNPYFMEELSQWLIAQGVIERQPDDTEWRVHAEHLPGLSVPGTLHGLLQARVEQLDTPERAVLQWAAVFGRTFWDGAVAYVGESSVPPERWAALERRDLVFPQRGAQLPGVTEWQFKHVLLRDAVYEGTLRKARAGYHRRAAEWLARATAGRVDEWAGVIAAHHEQAGDRAQAAEWYGRAGTQALHAFAPDKAAVYFRDALEYGGPEHPQRAHWHKGLADALTSQTHNLEALEACRTAIAAAEELGDTALQIRGWLDLGWIHDELGDYPAVLEDGRTMERLARATGNQYGLAQALFRQGWALRRMGNAPAAQALGEEALELSWAPGMPPDVRGLCFNLLGSINRVLGHYDEAVGYFRRALEVAQATGDRRRQGTLLSNIGEIARLRGDYDAAIPFYEQAMAVAQAVGDRSLARLVTNNLCGALAAQGGSAGVQAEAGLRAMLAAIGDTGWGPLSESYRFLAEACLSQGKAGEALAAARRAIALGEQTAQPEHTGPAWRVLGQAVWALEQRAAPAGDAPDLAPRACFEQSLRIAEEIGAEAEHARTLRTLAEYERAAGDAARADALWEEARAAFARLNMPREVERMA
jgi:class 3 adenylate cyclase/tetratricopeptide (TPR) repeat protein